MARVFHIWQMTFFSKVCLWLLLVVLACFVNGIRKQERWPGETLQLLEQERLSRVPVGPSLKAMKSTKLQIPGDNQPGMGSRLMQ